MRTRRKVLIGLVVTVLLAAAFVWATTPRSYGAHRQRVAMTYHHHISKARLTRYKTGVVDGSKAPAWIHCRTARSTFVGKGAVLGNFLLGGGISISFCYDGPIQGPLAMSHITRKPHRPIVNTWGQTASYSLWSYDGISSMVKGHGTRCDGVCWMYLYRRPYFSFRRRLDGEAALPADGLPDGPGDRDVRQRIRQGVLLMDRPRTPSRSSPRVAARLDAAHPGTSSARR